MSRNRINLVSLLAKRFLSSKSSDQFLSFISFVSAAGVALGVTALIVVTSVVNGFRGELAKVISSTNGEVILFSRGELIHDAPLLEEKITKLVPELSAVSGSLLTELMMTSSRGKIAGGLFEGVEWDSFDQVTSLKGKVIEGAIPKSPGEVLIGKELKNRLQVSVGEEINLLLPEMKGFEDSSAGSTLPKIVVAKVAGVIELGMFEYNSKYIYGDLAWLQEKMNVPGQITTFKMKLRPRAGEPRLIAERLSAVFGHPFRVKDWSQLNRNLLYSIELEKVVIAIILFAIVVVASFNVVSSLMMMLNEKSKEISILKAMGFAPMKSMQLFLLLGLTIGLGGVGVGLVLGLSLVFLLAKTQILKLPPDIYYLSRLPVEVRPEEILMICLITLGITLLVSLYPGLKVAKQSPIEGIRSV
jgi:lipoprotein-releasing system permease protein